MTSCPTVQSIAKAEADEDDLANCMGAWKAIETLADLQPAVLQSRAVLVKDIVSCMVMYLVPIVSPFIQQTAIELLFMMSKKYFDVPAGLDDAPVLAVNRLMHLFVIFRDHPDSGTCCHALTVLPRAAARACLAAGSPL